MTSIQHFCAQNDINGNPRRIYVASFEGEQVAAWDEGYLGSDAVPGSLRRMAYESERIGCTVKQYNQLKKLPSPDFY